MYKRQEGYIVGETVSIAGTYLGGATPANNLSFPVTKTTGSRVGIETTYTNVPSTNDGSGTGATFNITRDSNLDIAGVEVVTGGTGYAVTNTISIAGTYIGGATPTNNILLTPVECGTDVMPDELFVQKVDDVNFRVSGLSTSLPCEFTGLGTGTHLLKVQDPNKQALILIDNIIQTPITNKLLTVEVADAISASGENITVGAGIGSLSKGDILKVDDEFIKVKQIGEATFAQAKQAVANKVVDNNFYYDTKRANSNVLNVDTTTATMDDNPPY